jgi:hypothetical protein
MHFMYFVVLSFNLLSVSFLVSSGFKNLSHCSLISCFPLCVLSTYPFSVECSVKSVLLSDIPVGSLLYLC